MKWVERLNKIIRVAYLAGAVYLLIFVVLGYKYFVSDPAAKEVNRLKLGMLSLTETYVKIRSTDMEPILTRLNAQLAEIEKREKRLWGHSLSRESMPVLLTDLEKRAGREGMTLRSPAVNYHTKKGEKVSVATIDMAFEGGFFDVVHFLQYLDEKYPHLFVKDFHVTSQSRAKGGLAGKLQLVSLMHEEKPNKN